jgi:hypothetical protein
MLGYETFANGLLQQVTCGAWLAMTGAHPKVAQTVMRHQSITLTMDTYGHLFPGQEADAVARLRSMLTDAGDTLPSEALRATGTDDLAIDDPDVAQRMAQRMAQRAERETRRAAANGCDGASEGDTQKKSPKPLQIADLGDCVREGASWDASSGGGIRTPDTRIMIPSATPPNAEENGTSQDCAAHGAAVEHSQGPIDPDLAVVTDHWTDLPEAVRAGILAMVRASEA